MTQAPAPRPRSVKVSDPDALFAGWAFQIRKSHYPALGVTYRTFTANKAEYKCWAHDVLLRPDFHEGDVFYRPSHPDGSVAYLQVVAVLEPMVEVHTGIVGRTDRHGYLITSQRLVQWLRAGIDITGASKLYRGQGHAGAFAWLLSDIA